MAELAFLEQKPAKRSQIVQDAPATDHLLVEAVEIVSGDLQCPRAAGRWRLQFTFEIGLDLLTSFADGFAKNANEILGALDGVERRVLGGHNRTPMKTVR